MRGMVNKRTHPMRRKLNDAYYGFGDPEGNFSWSKFLAVWAQWGILIETLLNFSELIQKPESLLVCVVATIAPDTIRKLLVMKYGGSGK